MQELTVEFPLFNPTHRDVYGRILTMCVFVCLYPHPQSHQARRSWGRYCRRQWGERVVCYPHFSKRCVYSQPADHPAAGSSDQSAYYYHHTLRFAAQPVQVKWPRIRQRKRALQTWRFDDFTSIHYWNSTVIKIHVKYKSCTSHVSIQYLTGESLHMESYLHVSMQLEYHDYEWRDDLHNNAGVNAPKTHLKFHFDFI